MEEDKENGTSLITQSIFIQSSARPLSNKSSLNSLSELYKMSSPHKNRDESPQKRTIDELPRKLGSPRKFGSPRKDSQQKLDDSYSILQSDYTKLERQYTDLLLKNSALAGECGQFELELQSRENLILDQKDTITKYELYIKNSTEDYTKNKDLLAKETFYYKELISDLQLRVKTLKREIHTIKKANKPDVTESIADITPSNITAEPAPNNTTIDNVDPEEPASNNTTIDDVDLSQPSEDLKQILQVSEKFNRLLIDFKVLQSNFELERNSRLVLIDQIELLTKENEILSNQTSSKNSIHQEDLDLDIDDSVIHNIHTMNDLTDEDADSDTMLSYLAEDLNASSPKKEPNYEYSDASVEVANNFQFPEEPETETRSKRMSLPLKLRTPTFDSTEEFVLSPLKLAGNFDHDTPEYLNRYSSSKPSHSRYNSHDLFPIKVEFEEQPQFERIDESVTENTHRGLFGGLLVDRTLPDRSLPAIQRSSGSARNSAFLALSGGFEEANDSNRNSYSSSKRSSLMLEQPLDITKEEIMKLRFELQSLKLHNEKLLSYIGFEFQKQKNSLKKLSKKQSVRTLRALSHVSKQIEYSDSKLIEKSKEMLIHKKRILRSVSINPILSKNYGNRVITPIGLNGIPPRIFGNDDDEDDYGFLKHNDTFTKRIFSNGLQAYLNCDDLDDIDGIDESESENEIKRHKSQTFATKTIASDDEIEDVIEIKSESEGSSSEEELGMLKHIKFLILGPGAMKGHKKRQPPVADDGLKLKFLTISIGIIIIALKMSHQGHNN